MSRPNGVCKLCVEPKRLEDSHFIPRSLYDYCRGDGGLEPIKVTSELVLPTSRQAHAYLLCSSCEDLLNKGGETWLAPKLATWDKKFPLYDLVVSGPLIFTEDDWALYSGARNTAIDVAKIIHFAMGIYWKAAVHSWTGDTGEPQVELGPYAEEIRRFLLGAPFPQHVALAAVLSPPAYAYIGFNNPYEADRDSSYRNFMFCVPGIWFMLSVGKTIPQEMGVIYTSSRPENPILISRSIAAKGQETAFRVFKEARKTQAFARAMKKARSARGIG